LLLFAHSVSSRRVFFWEGLAVPAYGSGDNRPADLVTVPVKNRGTGDTLGGRVVGSGTDSELQSGNGRVKFFFCLEREGGREG